MVVNLQKKKLLSIHSNPWVQQPAFYYVSLFTNIRIEKSGDFSTIFHDGKMMVDLCSG